MSAPTLRPPSDPAAPSRPAPTPLRPSGLTWTVLRLHRAALLVWVAALLVAGALMTWLYVIGPDARAAVVPCATPPTDGLPDCATLRAIHTDENYGVGLDLVATALSYLMLPVAAWAGAALIGRELENGTAQLAWTQSVTPVRWLAAKLAVPAVLLTVGTTTAVVLHTVARRDGNGPLAGAWYDPEVYASTGPVTVAYALAGLALGALAGLVLRKALPAAGAAFAVTLALSYLMQALRPSLWPTTTITGRTALDLPPDVLVLEHGVVTSDGRRIGNDLACVGSETQDQIRACMKNSRLSDFWATVHPESHFWPLQLVESGVLLAVAGAAVAVAFTVLRRRTA
ncbi:ABC transporter permease subunit [Streptomyces sp. NBC_01281]|uniref:hypothetical protein n=1 Tax=Streptomyces sp. NBC_01281 TaxID=2903811 RepID=UPI002E12B7DE|nr:ABC transporter permease subunit [Streptomyces sp. NBC_01281]